MRPLWLIFALCLMTVLAAMAWISATALRLERAQTDAGRLAQLEENVRLALWRMDSIVAPVIAQETARPYFEYTAFTPAERAYTRMFSEISYGEVLIPSASLSSRPAFVRLHFQCNPDDTISSPQVPTGNMRDIAIGRQFTDKPAIECADGFLKQAAAIAPRKRLVASLPAPPKEDPLAIASQSSVNTLNSTISANVSANLNAPPGNNSVKPVDSALQQTARGQAEFAARNFALNNDNAQYQQYGNRAVGRASAAGPDQIRQAVMRPLWTNGQLILGRRVAVGRREYVQCCWLDWPAIQQSLIESIRDILPEARLEPATGAEFEKQPRMLASIPARLIPGSAPLLSATGNSPIRLTLILAWAAVLLGSAAVAALLAGAMALSERRAAFVSAVTHELRTPLTTLSMYAEMLEGEMVPPPQRQEYLATLRAEAQRLGHLVENVLAYARLERGRSIPRLQQLTIQALLASATPRAAQRLAQAGMQLVCDRDSESQSVTVLTDPVAVEQVFFNLADNAAKYAQNSPDHHITLTARIIRGTVQFHFTDHGPGICSDLAAKLFQPFSKSAADAAHSAPGVGLGLALCRRLARQMRGDLTLTSAHPGATFILSLPRP